MSSFCCPMAPGDSGRSSLLRGQFDCRRSPLWGGNIPNLDWARKKFLFGTGSRPHGRVTAATVARRPPCGPAYDGPKPLPATRFCTAQDELRKDKAGVGPRGPGLNPAPIWAGLMAVSRGHESTVGRAEPRCRLRGLAVSLDVHRLDHRPIRPSYWQASQFGSSIRQALPSAEAVWRGSASSIGSVLTAFSLPSKAVLFSTWVAPRERR